MESPLPEEFLALRREYLREALEKAAEVERLARGLEVPGEGGEDLRRALRQHAHRLRGSGGLYGFDAISAAAGALEDALAGGAAGQRVVELAAALAAAIRAARA